MRIAAALAVALLLLGACRSPETDQLVLDGSPRIPDVEGVVAEVSFTSLRLADGRTFEIDRDLQCFSTYTLKPLPVLGRKGQFVHLGTDGKKVRWIASIGAVVRGEEPAVFYTGTVQEVTEDRLAFRDGTVIRTAPGAEQPPEGAFVVVEIDPEDGVARRVSPG